MAPFEKLSVHRKKIDIPASKPLATKRDVFTGDLKIQKATGIELPNDWDQIPAISATRGQRVQTSEDLIFVVELPLYKAARLLYDAGIQTTESNAHFDPGKTQARMLLGILWESLNDSQKNFGRDLCLKQPDKWKHILPEEHGDGYEALYLDWEIGRETSPTQVQTYTDRIVEQLIKGRLRIARPK